MKRKAVLTLLTALLALWTITTWAAVPHLIGFEGNLKDGSGNPVANGSYSVIFTIYDALTGGSTLWSETQSVTTSNGLFSALLGSATALPDTIFSDSTRYLGIKVGADPEMTPRPRLASVGYSFTSNQWNSLDSNLFRLNGNVGIGTTAPNAKLEVFSYTSQGIISTSYATGGVGVQAYGAYRGLIAVGGSGPGVDGRAKYVGVSGSAGDYSPSPIYGCTGRGENNSTGDAYGGSFGGYAYGGGKGYGVSAGGTTYGVNGDSYNGYGVYGTSTNGYGVYGYSTGAAAVYGDNGGNPGTYGGYFKGDVKVERTLVATGGVNASSSSGNGVYGSSSTSTGVVGISGSGYGVLADGGTNGVVAYSHDAGGAAVFGDNVNYDNYGGYFVGNAVVTGTLFKGGLAFRIDHPLDPSNKYLNHSGVESPDMKNIYDGIVTTDVKGNATVTLPNWFGALNKDFRYQLTVIGDFAQAIISEEISGNQFSIKSDKPNVKVSWQVTGIRQDAYANAHRIQVEEDKAGVERGKYMHPKEHGMPEALGINYEMTQKLAAERKQQEEQQAKMEQERLRMEQRTAPVKNDK